MIGHLVGDGPHGHFVRVCQDGSYFVCGLYGVDVVEGEGFLFRDGQSGPDYGLGVDWGNEEG